MALPPPLPPARKGKGRGRPDNYKFHVPRPANQPRPTPGNSLHQAPSPSHHQPSPSHHQPSPSHHQTLSPRHSWSGNNAYPSPGSRPKLDIPPPIPTSMRPSLPPLPTSPTRLPDASYDSTILYPNEDDKFSLTELVDTYSSLLPLKVCVVKGFYGDRGEDCAIAVDEIYNFHFVKRARVVSISDKGKNRYVIPLNSAAKFGLIYEHGTMTFGTVEEIINAKTLPRVISVGTGYVGDKPESSVNRHEVLVVMGVEKGGRLRRKPPTLKVFSITKNMEKNLTKDVFGKFSTDPFSTQMYLPEFLNHINDPIPSKAMLYLDFESDEPLPDFMTSEAISMDRLYVETSIIATPLSEEDLKGNDDTDLDETETVDIPISLDIEVSVIPPAEDNDYEKLTEDTMNLLTHFDPSSAITHHVEDDGDEEYSSVAQHQFFKAVRKGFETEGLKIETPTKIRNMSQIQRAGPGRRRGSTASRGSSVDQEGYEDMSLLELNAPEDLRVLEASASPTSSPQTTPPPPPPARRASTPSSPKHMAKSPPPPLPPPLTRQSSTPTSPVHTPTPAPPTTFPKSKTLVRPVPPNAVSTGQDAKHPTPSGKAPPALPKPFGKKQIPTPVPEVTPIDDSAYEETEPIATAPSNAIPPKFKLPNRSTNRSTNGPTNRSTSGSKLSTTAPPLPDTKPPLTSDPSSSTLDFVQSALHDVVSRVQCLEQNTADRADIVSRLDQTVTRSEQLGKEVSQIKEDIKLLTELVGKLGSAGGGGGGAGGGNSAHQGSHEDEDETSELNLLNCSQIQKLLELMGLSKHQQTFQDAGVDGEILSECDDKVLLEDLAVTSRLDRIKLLQIISGKRSVRNIFQKSYVAFQPRN